MPANTQVYYYYDTMQSVHSNGTAKQLLTIKADCTIFTILDLLHENNCTASRQCKYSGSSVLALVLQVLQNLCTIMYEHLVHCSLPLVQWTLHNVQNVLHILKFSSPHSLLHENNCTASQQFKYLVNTLNIH